MTLSLTLPHKSRIKKKNLVPTPHDRFFRTAMANKRVAREFFENHLPQAFKAHADLETLHLEPDSLIDEELQLQLTDVLYSLTWKGKKAFLYTLIEHLRDPDPLMSFRNIKYRIGIMDNHLKKTGELPLVFVLVVYNGDTKYPYSTDLFDLFGEDKALAKETFLQPFDLIDLSQIADEKLKQRAWAGILELSLKHTRERDLLPFFRGAIGLIKHIFDSDDASYVMTIFNYLMSTGEVQDIEALRCLIHENLSNEQGEKVMTIAEHFRQEGIKIGIEKAKAESKTIAEHFRQEGIKIGIEKAKAESKTIAEQLRRKLEEEGVQKGIEMVAISLIQANLLTNKQIATIAKLPLRKIIELRRKYMASH